MKKLLILLAVGTALSLFYTNRTEAGELYRILNSDTLVTARRADLLTFMYLNSHGNKPAVRALYNQLGAQGLLINFQPGVVVKVTSFYGDGTAQIAGDRLIGYIATDDVSEYLAAITGLAGTPFLHRATRNGIFLAVNRVSGVSLMHDDV